MDGAATRSAEDLSREELHELVWQTPMTKLGPQLGTDGPGLAALCRKRRVPTPPLGYWQKKAVGRAPPTTPLPASAEPPPKERPSRTTVPARMQTRQAETVPAPLLEAEPASEASPAEDDDGLDPMRSLHPKVKAWVAEHRQNQEKRREENRRHRHDPWSWRSDPLPDLTQRDRYRFRATSTLMRAVEAAGGRVGEALIAGKATFLVSGQKLETTIAEKMTRPKKPLEDKPKWTAYPHSHNGALTSSGFLRVRIDTFVDGRSEWIETAKGKVAALLPEIVAAIIAAGPYLVERKRQREEEERRCHQEQMERYERQRRQEIDDKRWGRFTKWAESWEERDRLLAFTAELRRRLEAEGDATVEDRPLSEWLAWAEARAEALDPFRRGLRGLFEEVTKPEYPTYGWRPPSS